MLADDLFERRLRARQLLDLDEACAEVQPVLTQLRLDLYRLFRYGSAFDGSCRAM